MKKYIITAVVAAFQIVAVAQTVNVHFKNGQTIQYPSSNVDYVDFSEKAADPTVSAGQVVDLGLSVYWASCNLGAEKPEEYGDYYAWGETKTKNSFLQSNYSFYDTNKDEYINIGNDICGTQYDPVRVNLGTDWRMPTNDEIIELINNCTWEWGQINNVNGYIVIGKNGNSIFLPSTGMYHNSSTRIYNQKREGVKLWTGTLEGGEYAKALYCNNNGPGRSGVDRQDGLCIRPVTTNPNAGGNPIDHSQDYLVTDKVTASFTGGAYSQINNRIQAGSVLNTKFTNGSSEAVTLVSVQIFESGSSNAGNNALESEVEVAAGESKAYGLKLGTSMTTPVVRFTYRYNKKNYTAEATWNF